MKQAGHKVFEMPIIEVATNKVTTIGSFKANLNKNFEDLNNKILEYKNKCPNGFCYDGEEAATIGNVIKIDLILCKNLMKIYLEKKEE